MKTPVPKTALGPVAVSLFVWVWLTLPSWADSTEVTLFRTPDGGVQPQAAVDPAGAVHLIYFKGKPHGANMTLLVSCDQSASFQLETVNQWTTKACPMSTCAFAECNSGVAVATEREGQEQSMPRGTLTRSDSMLSLTTIEP